MRFGHIDVDGPGNRRGRRIGYTDWGDSDTPRVLICSHGLTRTGRDFDTFAAAMADAYRVICPDTAGRGKSGWLDDAGDYGYALYMRDTLALLAALNIENVDWVGTSMGGFLGMMLAAQPEPRIRRLVVNDIGPFIPKSALQRISTYLSTAKTFADLDEAEAYVRTIFAPFGPLDDAQWRHLAEHSVRPAEQGAGLVFHYDPQIAEGFAAVAGADIAVWDVWDAIRCPVLTVRGGDSDVLPVETAREMALRGPQSDLVEFPGTGHAPALMRREQIEPVRNWLLGGG